MPSHARAALVSLACSLLSLVPALGAGHPEKSAHSQSAPEARAASIPKAIPGVIPKAIPNSISNPISNPISNSISKPILFPGQRSTPEVRKIHFPDKSLGPLLLIGDRRGNDLWATYTAGKQVGSGQGTVTVTVPPDYALLMDVNRRVFENPILLKEVSPGLDALRVSFMSMEDREDHMLERAMPYVSYLKSLRVLFFDRSDVNDIDVSEVKDLPHLGYINLFLTRINGSCFAHMSTFPELYQLDVPCCALDQKCIAGLAQIRKLRYLDLSRTGMTIVGARSLSKLTGLTRLGLQENPRFDDECLKCLQPLKKLTWLDLKQTNVTFEGLKSLRGIQLRHLFVPSRFRKYMSEIKAMFPSAEIAFEPAPGAVNKDDKMIYAPLK